MEDFILISGFAFLVITPIFAVAFTIWIASRIINKRLNNK